MPISLEKIADRRNKVPVGEYKGIVVGIAYTVDKHHKGNGTYLIQVHTDDGIALVSSVSFGMYLHEEGNLYRLLEHLPDDDNDETLVEWLAKSKFVVSDVFDEKLLLGETFYVTVQDFEYRNVSHPHAVQFRPCYDDELTPNITVKIPKRFTGPHYNLEVVKELQ